jgi:outer membrane protein assembly factor BamB
LKNQLCNGLTLQVSEKQTYLLADYVTETTIYEFETLHPVVTIKREDSKGRNWVKLLDGIILYQENSSTLEAMDLRSQTVLWQYQLPEREVKFAGIRLGKLRDGFTDFELVHEAGELRVVAAATGGILVKLEARSGNAILLRKEFKGDANNAGLIPHFTLVDMNGDGLLDVVGGSVDGNIYCISGKDFSVLWEFDSGEECQMPCAFADINKDGIPDVFQANDRKRLVILNGKSGSLLFDHQLVENSRRGRQTLLWLAVLNEKGTIDILAEGEQSVLKILEIQETREKPFQILWNENQ